MCNHTKNRIYLRLFLDKYSVTFPMLHLEQLIPNIKKQPRTAAHGATQKQLYGSNWFFTCSWLGARSRTLKVACPRFWASFERREIQRKRERKTESCRAPSVLQMSASTGCRWRSFAFLRLPVDTSSPDESGFQTKERSCSGLSVFQVSAAPPPPLPGFSSGHRRRRVFVLYFGPTHEQEKAKAKRAFWLWFICGSDGEMDVGVCRELCSRARLMQVTWLRCLHARGCYSALQTKPPSDIVWVS